MALQITLLLFALEFVLVTGNQLKKDIIVLKLKIQMQNAVLQQLENVTQTQNEKITSLNEFNRKLQKEIDEMKNTNTDQEQELENLNKKIQRNNAKLQNQVNNIRAKMDAINNTVSEKKKQFGNVIEQNKMLQKTYTKHQQKIQSHTESIDKINVTLQNTISTGNNQQKLIKNITEHYKQMQKGMCT